MTDRQVRNRQPRQVGEANGRAKLDLATVLTIRAAYAHGGFSYQQLAAHFGIDRTQVGRIVRGEAWPEVPMPPSLAAQIMSDATSRPRYSKAAMLAAVRESLQSGLLADVVGVPASTL